MGPFVAVLFLSRPFVQPSGLHTAFERHVSLVWGESQMITWPARNFGSIVVMEDLGPSSSQNSPQSELT